MSVHVYTSGIGVRMHLYMHMHTGTSFIYFIHFSGTLVSNRFLMWLFLNRVFEKNLDLTEESMKHFKYVKLNVYFPCLGGKLYGFGPELEVSVLKGFLGSLKFSRMMACWKREGRLCELQEHFFNFMSSFFPFVSLFKLILFYFLF